MQAVEDSQSSLRPDCRLISLAVVPLLLAVVAANMYGMIQPMYAGLNLYDFEASYTYLFNGIGVIQGYVPGHIDHPGTPLQVFSGAISYLAWAFAKLGGQTTLDFNEAVMENPEHFIAIVSMVALFLNVAAILYLGIRVRAATKSLPMAWLAQGGFGLLNLMMPRLMYLSPEVTVIFAAVMVMACLSDVLLSEQPVSPRALLGSAAASGFFIALGLTTKVTFLPLILLLAVLPTAKAKIVGVLVFAVCSAIFLLPIVSALPRALDLYLRISQHSGGYGNGPRAFIDFSQVLPNLAELTRITPLLFVAGAACLVATATQMVRYHFSHGGQLKNVANGSILLAVLLAQLVMVVKHFGMHYILPALSISSVVLVWSIRNLFETPSGRRLGQAVGVVAVLVVAFFSIQQIQAYYLGLEKSERTRDYELALMNQIFNAHPGAIIVGAYKIRNQTYATNFAIGYLDPALSLRLTGGRPEQLSYNRWNDRLHRPGITWSPLTYLNDLIAEGREVLMVLPDDVVLPNIQGETLLNIPGKERVIKVIKVTN